MLHGENNPTLVRDTLLSLIMIVLNGMIGLSLLLGAWKHREQSYNLQGAKTYLGVIIPLAVLSVIMPNYTETTAGPTLSSLQESTLAVMSIGLYCAFLAVQTGRHRGYFTLGGEALTGGARTREGRRAIHILPCRDAGRLHPARRLPGRTTGASGRFFHRDASCSGCPRAAS